MYWDAKKRKAQINALPERIGAKQKRLLDSGGLFCFHHHPPQERPP